jgi:hypothetical protein
LVAQTYVRTITPSQISRLHIGRTRTINLLTHRHAITPTWAIMNSCTFKFNVWHLNTRDYPIEIYISDFHLRHLCIPTHLVKATHNIKTSLMKQCYTWCAWNCVCWYYWYWYAYYCWCMLILHALCSVLDQYIFHYCIMLVLNHVPLKLTNPTFHQIL